MARIVRAVAVPSLNDLVTSSEERQDKIVEVLVAAFEDLIEADPRAFRRKFRKMAADPFAFYRGSAVLFYDDVARLEDPWADERSGRVWIQGDLHAENYGTYMDSVGIFVFDVNDFDEAYLGHYTWDLQRMAASLALLGFGYALSDDTIEKMIVTYGRAYVDQVRAFATGDRDEEFRLTLETTGGLLREFLQTARGHTRLDLLESTTTLEGHGRRFSDGPGVRRLEDDEHESVLEAYREYLETIPETKRQQSVSYEVKDIVGRRGFGIGSAGLPAYNLLVEGRTQALDNDVVLSMKQANIPAVSRFVDTGEVDAYFEHEGHRTVVSQRALQVHTDPLLGYTELDGVGYVVSEVSPYEVDLDWGGLTEPDEIAEVVTMLGRATAKIHCASDEDSAQDLVNFQVEDAIARSVESRRREFTAWVTDFGMEYAEQAREDHVRFVNAFREGRIGVSAT
jgi:uncharacterized protein (DUF2252 family)